ncbi:MAG TPA: mycofactocin-associated electron transfer flavoprotein beta subunit [Acidimicrobiales bacterium]|nr:mycofactocin-associated electron transfer flavoprotein beta subunit [Acidimicrobiales bacterium]
MSSGAGAASTAPTLAVCLKWVDRRPEVEPLTGAVTTDPRTSGASDADLAALELGLRLGEAWRRPVIAVSAGGPEADALLRQARACGAARAVRVALPAGATSAAVAAGLAGALEAVAGGSGAGGGHGELLVLCGAWSLDGGSGSVPAFLAAALGAAQALGLVGLRADGPGRLAAERRLDGGRRERLVVEAPAVVSVEAGVARLRRAGLAAVRSAATAPVEVVAGGEAVRAPALPAPRIGPYRPRPKVVAPPAGATARERVLALTGLATPPAAARTLTADPEGAADAILEQLRAWGYLG